MCARRFLIFVFVMTLLVVAGAFALFQFGGDVLLRSATPRGHFKEKAAGSAPNYAEYDSWISRPSEWVGQDLREVPDDPSHWPPPQGLVNNGIRVGATFYIHPTTYLERDRWNAPLHPDAQTEGRTRLFVKTQSTAVDPNSAVWAPRYRQAAYGAFLLDSDDAQRSLDLAYGDIAEAFDQFLAANPTGPIILAAHSQGALHLIRLLREKVAGRPVAQRLVAAYVVGWPISRTADLAAIGLPACASPEQTGCLLSWLTFRDPANPKLILAQWEGSKGLNGQVRRQHDILCSNPITGTIDGADKKGVGGIVVPTADKRDVAIDYNSLGAHCAGGLLIADGELPDLGSYALPGNNYHVYDFALFWGAIRQDSMRRWTRWANDHN